MQTIPHPTVPPAAPRQNTVPRGRQTFAELLAEALSFGAAQPKPPQRHLRSLPPVAR